MIGGPVIILGVVAYFVLTSGRFETTDDAYVEIGKTPIAPSVPGRVIEIDVGENQTVAPGATLFKLDPVDVEASVHRAEASLASARLQVTTLRSAVAQAQVDLASAQRTAAHEAREADRQARLLAAGVASAQQAADAKHAADLAADHVTMARQQLATAQANLGEGAKDADAFPGALAAKAQLETEQLNLKHTLIIAPAAGVVTKVDQLQPGAYLNPGQTVFYLLSGRPWVEANFKENQLAKMRIGQPVKIKIDALGGQTFKGHVESFAPGSGSSFSPLPAQNATGNWVKVVQRLPVRIAFDELPPGIANRAGLSAKVTVDVRNHDKGS